MAGSCFLEQPLEFWRGQAGWLLLYVVLCFCIQTFPLLDRGQYATFKSILADSKDAVDNSSQHMKQILATIIEPRYEKTGF